MIRILVISDTHVGSHVGLCLPEAKDNDYGLTHIANAVQMHLFDKWCSMLHQIGHVDILILNGDIVEGVNKKEDSVGVFTTNVHAQAYVASALIDMIDYDDLYVLEGTDYHVGKTSGDHIVCEILNGTWLGMHEFIDVDQVKFHARHKAKFSSVKYGRCTSQRKETMDMRLDGVDIDIALRSHTHKFVFSGDAHDITVNTPCWKGLDKFIVQNSIELPDNGYVLFEVEGANYHWDYSIFNIPHAIYGNRIVIKS